MDFIALNTINATEPTKAMNNVNVPRQPTGTNHFQFRFHQLGLGVSGTVGGFCSMKSFYFSPEASSNHSFKGYRQRISSFVLDVARYIPLARRPLPDIDLDTPIPTTDQPFRAMAAVWNSLQRLNSVLQRCFAGGTRAMNATIDLPIRFHTVPHDPAVAVRADRRQRVDRAFEAIECMMFSGYDHFKRLVIFILANFACSHT